MLDRLDPKKVHEEARASEAETCERIREEDTLAGRMAALALEMMGSDRYREEWGPKCAQLAQEAYQAVHDESEWERRKEGSRPPHVPYEAHAAGTLLSDEAGRWAMRLCALAAGELAHVAPSVLHDVREAPVEDPSPSCATLIRLAHEASVASQRVGLALTNTGPDDTAE